MVKCFKFYVSVHLLLQFYFWFSWLWMCLGLEKIRLWINFLIFIFNQRLIGWYFNLICDLNEFRDYFDWTISNDIDWTFTIWSLFVVTMIIRIAWIWWTRLMLLNMFHIMLSKLYFYFRLCTFVYVFAFLLIVYKLLGLRFSLHDFLLT